MNQYTVMEKDNVEEYSAGYSLAQATRIAMENSKKYPGSVTYVMQIVSVIVDGEFQKTTDYPLVSFE